MIGQLAVAVGAALVVLIVAGQLARVRLARRYPPTGRLVDIGGYRLHIDERGPAVGPTVVLEGGTSAPSLTWAPILTSLASFVRVVAYDRAGLGWSDPSPRPRTAAVMAEELHVLLRTADVPGPYILVGHSFGGTIARVFAHRHPDLVAGMVLVDAAHEDQFRLAPPAVRTFMDGMARRMPIVFGMLGIAVRSGLLALRPAVIPVPVGPLPADALAAIRARVASVPSVIGTMGRETGELEVSNDEVRSMAIRTVGPIPLEVISHGRPDGVPPQLGAEVAAAYEDLWQDLQVQLAHASPRGHRVVARGVGHAIPTEEPGIVVDAVRTVLASARSSRQVA